MKRQPVQAEEMPVFIGIDYHKAYSVYNVLNAQGDSLGEGRINHAHPEDFRALVRRWPGCRVVFEVGMNGTGSLKFWRGSYPPNVSC
jgi:hypothetical protein